MAKCRWCKTEGLTYKFNENLNVNKLWDKNREIFHNCDQNPYDRRKKIDDWEKRFQKNTRFLAPVWCNVCKVAYRSNSVCGHILRDGFKEGVDSIKFYSDHPQMVQRRNLIKKRVNQSIKTFF